ncbi:MAG TPA: DUF4159 domain-containing protein [Haliangiales bacterium]|nr:DUF4159 domain-containing protein [Haliangiales bacterium]
MTTRRAFLAGCLAAALWPRRARAIGPASQFRFGELTIGGLPQPGTPRALSLTRLGTQIDLRTSIDVARVASAPVQLHSPKLFETPFLYMAADRRFPIPPARDLEALRRFLTFGGFLVIDSAEGRAGGEVDASVRQLVAEVFPPATGLAPLSEDHVIYKTFYLLAGAPGRVAVSKDLEGVTRDDRTVIVYNQNDMAGAWAKDDFGNFAYPCYPGGERQRELAIRLGINLVMYALCLDYKTDQVHVPFILKRRKWKVDD